MQRPYSGVARDEVAEEIEHQTRIVRALRQRLRQREVQEATHGINAPPEVVTEISQLSERINGHEDIILSLKTVAVEDRLTLAEAEYKLITASAYDTVSGRPTVVGVARLEFERLRLGINLEKARLIEYQIKEDLVKEACYQILINWPDTFYYLCQRVMNGQETNRDAFLAQTIGKAVRLNKGLALDMLPVKFKSDNLESDRYLVNHDSLLIALSFYNKVSTAEDKLFSDFVEELLARVDIRIKAMLL